VRIDPVPPPQADEPPPAQVLVDPEITRGWGVAVADGSNFGTVGMRGSARSEWCKNHRASPRIEQDMDRLATAT
jgi:hypothetical protein